MRTTPVIDDDVLAAVRAIARQRQQTIGQALSTLARSALHPPVAGAVRNGIPLLPVRQPNAIVTLEVVNELRDESP